MSFVPSMTVTGQQVCRIGASVQDVFTILCNLKKERLFKQVRANEMDTVSLEKTNRIIPILDSSNAQCIDENICLINIKLSVEEQKEISDFLDKFEIKGIQIPCHSSESVGTSIMLSFKSGGRWIDLILE
nr:hypothetical protein L204_02622 [Cryptococcus depauperatus CBS 7855]